MVTSMVIDLVCAIVPPLVARLTMQRYPVDATRSLPGAIRRATPIRPGGDGAAAEAEAAGFDGFFLWDHVRYRPPVQQRRRPMGDAGGRRLATERVRIGPLVTPSPAGDRTSWRGSASRSTTERRPVGTRRRARRRELRRVRPFGDPDDPTERAPAARRRARPDGPVLGRRVRPAAGAATPDPGLGRLAVTESGAPGGGRRGGTDGSRSTSRGPDDLTAGLALVADRARRLADRFDVVVTAEPGDDPRRGRPQGPPGS